MNNDKEVWKRLKESKSIFISNKGNVASNGNISYEATNDRESDPFVINVDGKDETVYRKHTSYMGGTNNYLGFGINGHKEEVHKFVAKYFCPDYDGDKEVHHKDLDKYNNNASNLQPLTSAAHVALHQKINKQKSKKY